MDLQQIKTKRQDVAAQILVLLKKFEEETGVFVEYVNTESDMDLDSHNVGLKAVTVDLTLG